MKLYELLEARRNPEQNPKESPVEILRRYKDDPDIFISFKGIPKMGMNPEYSFKTPMGVYFYPLQAFWQKFASSFEKGQMPTHFATNYRYLYVVKYNGKGKKEIRDTTKYTHADRMRDFDELRKLGYDVDNAFSRIPNNQYTTNEFGKFWNTINELTSHISGVYRNGPNKKSFAKNKILRQLNYAYISEPAGQGVIHPNEAEQGFFTSGAYIKTVQMIDTQIGKEQADLNTTRITKKIAVLDKQIKILQTMFSNELSQYNDEAWAVEDEYEGYDEKIKWKELEWMLLVDQQNNSILVRQRIPDFIDLGYLRVNAKNDKVTITAYDTDKVTVLTSETVNSSLSLQNQDDYHEAVLNIMYKFLNNSPSANHFSELTHEARQLEWGNITHSLSKIGKHINEEFDILLDNWINDDIVEVVNDTNDEHGSDLTWRDAQVTCTKDNNNHLLKCESIAYGTLKKAVLGYIKRDIGNDSLIVLNPDMKTAVGTFKTITLSHEDQKPISNMLYLLMQNLPEYKQLVADLKHYDVEPPKFPWMENK